MSMTSSKQQPQFDAVLFDLDGTLVDTAPDFISVVNLLRQEENLSPLGDDAIRKQVSNGARALITLAFELKEGETGFDAMRQRLLDLYIKNLSVKSCLFEGGDKLLAFLEDNNIPWGIATNKPSLYAVPLIKDLGLNCGSLICPDHVTRSKPDPEALHKAAAELNVLSDRCLYVGDHRRDIEAGKNAGMKTVAALYGYIDDNDSPTDWQADYNINSMTEIESILFP